MRLMIAVPTLDFIHTEFVKSLLALTKYLHEDGVEHDVVIQSGTLVYVARDNLAKKAVAEGYTHVLWLDSDMVFHEDLLDDLMFSGHQMVTAICHSRRPPHLSCCFRSLDPIDRYTLDEYPDDVFRIAGCGCAALLMETEVLRKVLDECGTAFAPMRALGEDLAFCFRAGLCGIEIYADPRVRVGHIGHIVIYPEDEERYIASIQGGKACLSASKKQ